MKQNENNTQIEVSKFTQLLVCPFCGSDGEIVTVGNEYYPRCSRNKKGVGYCYASRRPILGEDGFNFEKDAIDVWNRRSQIDANEDSNKLISE